MSDPAQLSAPAFARFEREVQATGALTHPNTVRIFDYGRTPEGIFCDAMELPEGTNLDALVARVGRLPEARVIYLLKQACGSPAEDGADDRPGRPGRDGCVRALTARPALTWPRLHLLTRL